MSGTAKWWRGDCLSSGGGSKWGFSVSLFSLQRNSAYKPGLAWFYGLMAACLVLLLTWGAKTTSTDAGMAFLDWPFSNGSINPPGWISKPDQNAEHGHRLLGASLGFLAIILVVWTHLKEGRGWVRNLTRILLLMVILQGLMGGARVKFDILNLDLSHNLLAQAFAVFHALGAQVTLCLLATLIWANSRHWFKVGPETSKPSDWRLREAGVIAVLLCFLMVFIGAVVRHGSIGMAIPTFPHAAYNLDGSAGSWIPANWNWAVAVNFLHRIGAVLTVFTVGYLYWQARRSSVWPWLKPVACVALAVVFLQFGMGAWTVLSGIKAVPATLHTLGGAFLLASCWSVVLLTYRFARAR